MGKIERLYICAQRGDPVERIDEATLETGKGIVGDRYHAMAAAVLESGTEAAINQLTLIEKEKLDTFLEENNSNIDYGDFRRSIITSGIELNDLVGKQFSVGDVLCIGTELCEPCRNLAQDVHRAVLPELVHKAGIRAKILCDGTIKAGDSIE